MKLLSYKRQLVHAIQFVILLNDHLSGFLTSHSSAMWDWRCIRQRTYAPMIGCRKVYTGCKPNCYTGVLDLQKCTWCTPFFFEKSNEPIVSPFNGGKVWIWSELVKEIRSDVDFKIVNIVRRSKLLFYCRVRLQKNVGDLSFLFCHSCM